MPEIRLLRFEVRDLRFPIRDSTGALSQSLAKVKAKRKRSANVSVSVSVSRFVTLTRDGHLGNPDITDAI